MKKEKERKKGNCNKVGAAWVQDHVAMDILYWLHVLDEVHVEEHVSATVQ